MRKGSFQIMEKETRINAGFMMA